jgi:hypothetical protein
MLLYQPRFQYPDNAASPPNLAEAEANEAGLTPVYPDTADLAVDVQTPSGEVLSIDNPALITNLPEGLDNIHTQSLLLSPNDVQSLVSQMAEEVGMALDKRRFRANIYTDLTPMVGFVENAFVGRKLQIGTKAVIAITDRDPRCKMITLDPDTAEASPEILRRIWDAHGCKAGLYGAVRRRNRPTRRRNQSSRPVIRPSEVPD